MRKHNAYRKRQQELKTKIKLHISDENWPQTTPSKMFEIPEYFINEKSNIIGNNTSNSDRNDDNNIRNDSKNDFIFNKNELVSAMKRSINDNNTEIINQINLSSVPTSDISKRTVTYDKKDNNSVQNLEFNTREDRIKNRSNQNYNNNNNNNDGNLLLSDSLSNLIGTDKNNNQNSHETNVQNKNKNQNLIHDPYRPQYSEQLSDQKSSLQLGENYEKKIPKNETERSQNNRENNGESNGENNRENKMKNYGVFLDNNSQKQVLESKFMEQEEKQKQIMDQDQGQDEFINQPQQQSEVQVQLNKIREREQREKNAYERELQNNDYDEDYNANMFRIAKQQSLVVKEYENEEHQKLLKQSQLRDEVDLEMMKYVRLYGHIDSMSFL